MRGLARRLRALLAGVCRAGNGGATPVSPEAILIVGPESRSWRNRLAATLDRYGIPHDVGASRRLSGSANGSFDLRLPAFDVEPPSGDDPVWLLSSPYVSGRRLWGDVERISERGLARLFRRRRLRQGDWAAWERIALDIAARCDAEAADAEDEDAAARSRRRGEEFRRLISVLRTIREWLSAGGLGTGADWAAWLLDLLGAKRLGTTGLAAMYGQDGAAVSDFPPVADADRSGATQAAGGRTVGSGSFATRNPSVGRGRHRRGGARR